MYDPTQLQIDRIGLQGDAMTIAISDSNPMIDEDIKLFAQSFSQDDEMISERLRVLSKMLKDMNY